MLKKTYLMAYALTSAMSCTLVQAQASSALDKVLNATAVTSIPLSVSEVRADALKEIGGGLGMRAGLADESRNILAQINKEKNNLDRKFQFGSLTFPTGALPPVIIEPQDVISVMDYSMRVAGKIYKIESPARFIPVNWRDYLFLGLSYETDPIIGDEQRKLYPRDADETTYWKKVVLDGYNKGRQQAKKIFDVNLARLERDFNGMQLFYELNARGLVSAPVVASATESVSRPDANTIIIGETLFRITSQPTFDGNAKHWKATK